MNAKISIPPSLVDLSYEKIKQDISKDFLKPGQKINIKQLCERYDVSETPIKQALNRLMMEGLVENIPRKGMKLKRITWAEIDEILDLRLMMESHLIPQVLTAVGSNQRLQEEFEKNLREHFEYVEKFSNTSEYFTVYDLDQKFHELYLKCSGNRMAVKVYNSLNSHAYATYLYGKQPREKTLAGVREHQMVYEALLERDSEKVLKLVQLHYKNAKEIIYLVLKIGNTI